MDLFNKFKPEKKFQYERPQELPNLLQFLLKTEKFADCSFVVGKESSTMKVYREHQLILSAASPVFETMFFGGMVQGSPIEICDIEPTIYEMFLDYIIK